MSLTPLIQTAQALRAMPLGNYHYESFMDTAHTLSHQLTDAGLPGDELRSMLSILREYENRYRPLGPWGAETVVRKLTEWHLLPQAGQDPVTSYQQYQAECDYHASIYSNEAAVEDVDWDKIHPVYNLKTEFKDLGPEASDYYVTDLRKMPIEIPHYTDLRLLTSEANAALFVARPEDAASKQVLIKVIPISWIDAIDRVYAFENNLSPLLSTIAAQSALMLVAQDSGFTAAGDPYLIMDYVDAGNLKKWRHAGDLRRALPLASQVVDEIAVMHKASAAHLDIHPGNILIEDAKKPRIRLLDFDSFATADQMSQYRDNLVAGVPGYAARENWLPDFTADFTTDVFSLSATLYYMLTAEDAFGEAIHTAFLRKGPADIAKAMSVTPKAPSDINAAVSSALDAVILRGLSADRGARHSNAVEFQADFRRALARQ